MTTLARACMAAKSSLSRQLVLCGRNVGAGMTVGIAYFLDENGTLEAKVNREYCQAPKGAHASRGAATARAN